MYWLSRAGPVTTVIINRPTRRNAVNEETAGELLEAFEAFEGYDGRLTVEESSPDSPKL